VRTTITLLAAALLSTVLTACGGDEEPAGDARRIEIDMVDNAYRPDAVEVAAGERVTFVFSNEGEVVHEAYVGTAEDQEAHAEEMAGGDDGGHDMEDMDDVGGRALEVEPGDTSELTYTFADAGEYVIGCHQPGHYEAGMSLAVEIA